MPGELQPKALILPKDRATPKEQMPPAPPASPPPAPAVKTERSPKSSPSVVSSDLGFNAAKQFIRSQFAECDITTFDVDEGDKNWLKAATSQDRLSLSTEDTRRLERALRKSKMDTLPVGSVLEHRLSSYRHRMVLRKFSNDVFALDTAGMHKEKSSDEEGFVCDSIIFARNKSGKWFLLPYTRLVTSYRGAMETRMNEKVRTRLSWLEMGAEGATGHSLASYSPERPTYTNFLAKRSPKDAPIHRVPTHDIPFCQVVAGENGIGGELAEKIERVLGQLESGIPKIGRYLRFEQNWGHAIYVMKLAENSYAIQTHTQRTAENGITLNGVDVMMVRRAEGGKHWEIAQLEFNGTDFVAVAEPDRYLGKDGRYDARFSMIEAGLAKQK